MTSENNTNEQNDHITTNNLSSLPNISDADQSIELNNRIRNDFMSYCFSFLQDNEEAHQCVQIVWNKYLQCVGDIAILSAFFDTLPFHIKTSILPKYQIEIIEWCKNLFHFNSHALLCSTYYSETFQRVIRYAFKTDRFKKGIIYVPMDFDTNLKIDLTSSLSNIKFEHISNDISSEDMIDINQLEELIKRDINDTQSYPFMVIANAGSALLGHCDQLTKIKKLCEQYNIWLHVIGDLLGSLALFPTIKENVNINCDSLTIDIMKLFGIQNLPYLTFFLQSTTDIKQIDDNKSLVTSHPLYDFILHSPSISFLSVWSISQRCSRDTILSHMKVSFDLTNFLLTNLKDVNRLRILNNDNHQETYNYQRICSGDVADDVLPKPVAIFRFEPNHILEVENMDDINGYIDLLNLWLFDKLSQHYPKMNLELLKSVHFQMTKSNNTDLNQAPAHAIRFAPLEHLLDVIYQNDIQLFIQDIQRYIDILHATMTGRKNLSLIISNYENLSSIPMPNWAGVGAVRYIPSHINLSDIDEISINEINTIQAELARQLQTNDTAFSLGGGGGSGSGTDEYESMFYLRLGMIRKSEDLDILLHKILNAGKETETSLKYVEDMAEKIRTGIEKVQKDLQDENLQLFAQEGLLRHLPLVSNIMSWWSPSQSTPPLAIKGRSFDLNSGQIESTEDTYAYRMQIKKQSPHAPMHNNDDTTSINSNNIENSTDLNTNQ
ncbi:unnamed protein product [Rotaria sordida]|uniref:Pyridoxal-dependent decarboxylase domain-containing protein 1 n=1 Tax=Rotaria sordida TaxID=392033 RepID=A0A815CP29_9BILA|nr:unnamed protein product [Rotaria sordida]CAF3714526.1 unnamed protein product [Rotaria sordida]